MEQLGEFDSGVIKKFEEMRGKNEFLLQCFPTFPLSETVIQNYRCTFKQGDNSFGGKIWLTQNYVLFTESSASGLRKQIPYMDIKTIGKQDGYFGYTSEMFLDLENGLTVSFTNFYHFHECYTLISYLMDHSPCYYHIPSSAHSSTNSYVNSNPIEDQGEDQSKQDGRWGSLAISFKEEPIEKYIKPDVKLAEECLDVAEEIYLNGLNTRGVLEDDARTLDQIERNMEETAYHIKKGKRETDAIGSLGGQMKKMVMGGLVDKKLGAYEAPDRSAGSQEAEKFYDVPILVKHPNCDLEPAVLRFGDKEFLCVSYPDPSENSKNLELLRDYKYTYSQAKSVVVRVRPLHLDIRFLNETETPRFRCVSSHIQMIVNELVLRTNSRVDIVFEPGTRKFEYDDVWLRNHPLQSNREKSGNSCLFERQSVRVTEVIVHAPKEIKQGVERQDQIVQSLQDTVGNIKVNMEDIKNEAKRQIKQTEGIHQSANKTLEASHKQDYNTRKLV